LSFCWVSSTFSLNTDIYSGKGETVVTGAVLPVPTPNSMADTGSPLWPHPCYGQGTAVFFALLGSEQQGLQLSKELLEWSQHPPQVNSYKLLSREERQDTVPPSRTQSPHKTGGQKHHIKVLGARPWECKEPEESNLLLTVSEAAFLWIVHAW
jgi:hypothetical protein